MSCLPACSIAGPTAILHRIGNSARNQSSGRPNWRVVSLQLRGAHTVSPSRMKIHQVLLGLPRSKILEGSCGNDDGCCGSGQPLSSRACGRNVEFETVTVILPLPGPLTSFQTPQNLPNEGWSHKTLKLPPLAGHVAHVNNPQFCQVHTGRPPPPRKKRTWKVILRLNCKSSADLCESLSSKRGGSTSVYLSQKQC